ncbi:MAG: hypothetical protein JO341_04315 [Gammaproteobacteria bacterium]|nr:hypothetical protein [Gammaproteobacteria bacterium]MBV9620226.1 hypothetical protein [Gammaproteobacteria bacterium]
MSIPEPDTDPELHNGGPVSAYRQLPRARRTALQLLVALICGVLLMPLVIWLVGSRILGPYTHAQNPHAGPLALLADFLGGLAHGAPVYWVVALGPALLWLLGRLGRRIWRSLP